MWQEYKHFCTFINTRGRHRPWARSCDVLQHPHSIFWCECMRATLVTIKSKGPSVRGEGVLAHHQPLLLHSAVLKPDFHLLVAQVQPVGQLLPLLSVDEFVHQKFIFQFGQLRFGVGLSLLPALHLCRAPRSTYMEWGSTRAALAITYVDICFGFCAAQMLLKFLYYEIITFKAKVKWPCASSIHKQIQTLVPKPQTDEIVSLW